MKRQLFMANKVFNLGTIDSSWMSNEDVAERIISILEREKKRDPSNLYRGVACDLDKYNLIKRTGTDRNEEGREQAIRLNARRDAGRSYLEGITPRKSATIESDPNLIWATTEEELPKAVSFAIDELTSANHIGALIVYDGNMLTEERSGYTHRFRESVNPKKAMKALFRLREP